MLAPFIRMALDHGKEKNPKRYRLLQAIPFSILALKRGEGWYIVTPNFEMVGPATTREQAEDALLAALDELRGKPMSDEERQKARDHWRKG